MLGAIIGDIVGSVYEWSNIKSTDFPLFKQQSKFTDDSVLTVATAKVILDDLDYSHTYQDFTKRILVADTEVIFLVGLIPVIHNPIKAGEMAQLCELVQSGLLLMMLTQY